LASGTALVMASVVLGTLWFPHLTSEPRAVVEQKSFTMLAEAKKCFYEDWNAPDNFGRLTGGYVPGKPVISKIVEDTDGKYIAGVQDGHHFKMAKFEASGVGVPSSGKYTKAPSDAADMVTKYQTAKSVGNNYKFTKNDGFSCPATAPGGKYFNSEYDRWTSPYYLHKGLCPEGEGIILKDDCEQAGALFGLPTFKEEIVARRGVNPGCTRTYYEEKIIWNPNLKAKFVSGDRLSMCKKLPKDMHDFAALQADLKKMTFHCLNAASKYVNFRQCMLDMERWNLDKAWTKADMEAQRKAADKLEAMQAQEAQKVEKACWKKHSSKVAGDLPGSFEAWPGSLVESKVSCTRMGSKCGAVTCYKQTKIGGGVMDQCKIRGPHDQIKNAPSKYTTYTPC